MKRKQIKMKFIKLPESKFAVLYSQSDKFAIICFKITNPHQ